MTIGAGRRRDAAVEGSRYSQIAGIDPERLDAFRAGIRKRYSDEQILAELRASAERLGRSPTMREFAADPETTVHPQTVIGHFGSWNAAKRRAGLVPRRFATREELLARLRELGEELGRTPTARDLETRRGSMPSKSLYWHTFGSLTNALREAGFDVPVGEERLARAIEQGVFLAIRSGRLPKFADWAEARRSDPSMLTEWQVYRMFEARRGAWSTFQFLVREQLAKQGVEVAPDGALAPESSGADGVAPDRACELTGQAASWRARRTAGRRRVEQRQAAELGRERAERRGVARRPAGG